MIRKVFPNAEGFASRVLTLPTRAEKEIQGYLYNNDSWLLSEGDSDTDLF